MENEFLVSAIAGHGREGEEIAVVSMTDAARQRTMTLGTIHPNGQVSMSFDLEIEMLKSERELGAVDLRIIEDGWQERRNLPFTNLSLATAIKNQKKANISLKHALRKLTQFDGVARRRRRRGERADPINDEIRAAIRALHERSRLRYQLHQELEEEQQQRQQEILDEMAQPEEDVVADVDDRE